MADLTDAVKVGRRSGLESLRDHLARALLDAEPREVAGIARQLQSVLSELDGLRAPDESNAVDEINAKRAARRQSTSVAAGGTAKGVKRG